MQSLFERKMSLYLTSGLHIDIHAGLEWGGGACEFGIRHVSEAGEVFVTIPAGFGIMVEVFTMGFMIVWLGMVRLGFMVGRFGGVIGFRFMVSRFGRGIRCRFVVGGFGWRIGFGFMVSWGRGVVGFRFWGSVRSRFMVSWGRFGWSVRGRFVVSWLRDMIRCRFMISRFRFRGSIRGRFMVGWGRFGWGVRGRFMVSWGRGMVGLWFFISRCRRGIRSRFMVGWCRFGWGVRGRFVISRFRGMVRFRLFISRCGRGIRFWFMISSISGGLGVSSISTVRIMVGGVICSSFYGLTISILIISALTSCFEMILEAGTEVFKVRQLGAIGQVFKIPLGVPIFIPCIFGLK